MSTSHHSQPQPPPPPRPVLVVDDDAALTKTLCMALERAGFQSAVASDGAQAYKMIKDSKYHCMLLDVNMPEISGIELLMLMQAEGLHVPAIVMASFEDFSEKELKGFDNVLAYMPKPFPLSEMVAAVKRCAT